LLCFIFNKLAINKQHESIKYYQNDKPFEPSFSFIPVLSLPNNTLLSLHLFGFL